MKKIYFISSFLMVCLLSGCSIDSEWNIKSLPGTWQLEAVYYSPGGAQGSWNSVENGYTYSFGNNGTFSSNRFEDCEQGTYTATGNELRLDYGCEGFTLAIEDEEGVLVEEIRFDGKYMILIPKYLDCVEGCQYRFRKIAPAN